MRRKFGWLEINLSNSRHSLIVKPNIKVYASVHRIPIVILDSTWFCNVFVINKLPAARYYFFLYVLTTVSNGIVQQLLLATVSSVNERDVGDTDRLALCNASSSQSAHSRYPPCLLVLLHSARSRYRPESTKFDSALHWKIRRTIGARTAASHSTRCSLRRYEIPRENKTCGDEPKAAGMRTAINYRCGYSSEAFCLPDSLIFLETFDTFCFLEAGAFFYFLIVFHSIWVFHSNTLSGFFFWKQVQGSLKKKALILFAHCIFIFSKDASPRRCTFLFITERFGWLA